MRDGCLIQRIVILSFSAEMRGRGCEGYVIEEVGLDRLGLI